LINPSVPFALREHVVTVCRAAGTGIFSAKTAVTPMRQTFR
jgi:hypothetical protein